MVTSTNYALLINKKEKIRINGIKLDVANLEISYREDGDITNKSCYYIKGEICFIKKKRLKKLLKIKDGETIKIYFPKRKKTLQFDYVMIRISNKDIKIYCCWSKTTKSYGLIQW